MEMTAPVPASSLLAVQKSRRDYLPTGIGHLDRMIPGLPRGAVSEVTGARSSGRTSLLSTLLAAATARGECCAVVDSAGGFDPLSASRAGVRMERLLWVRAGGDASKSLKTADLVVHAGGFGLICLDLTGVPPRVLNKIPISYWFRFKRAVEHSSTVFLVLSERAQARSTSSCWLDFAPAKPLWSGRGPFTLLRGFRSEVWVRKPGQPRPVYLEAKAF